MDDLTNWWVSGHRLNLVQHLTDPNSHLHGESRIRGGKPVITSSVVKVEFLDGHHVVTTKSGKQYRLLTVDPAYQAWLVEA